jgi:hypothetical protein
MRNTRLPRGRDFLVTISGLKGALVQLVFFVLTAIESFFNLDKAPFLPGGGVGIRYMAIPKERINVGMDFVLGKDDWGIYFWIGESFGR